MVGGIETSPRKILLTFGLCMFDILKIWKAKEEKELGRWESRKHFPSVIDPAVGEGVFLKVAVETGFTKTDYIFGLDIDEEVVKKWKQINLKPT